MKMYKLIVLFLVGSFLVSGCGKPNEAESLDSGSDFGGYTIVSKTLIPGYANDVVVKDSLVYMAQGEGGLSIVNVTNPSAPEVVSVTTEDVRGYSSKIIVHDTTAYIAAGSFGVTVVNITDPLFPIVTDDNTSMKPAKNLHIMGDFLYTAVSEQGVAIAEISYPTQPDPRGDIQTTGFAQCVTTTSDTAYLLAACGEMGLSMINISDFQNGYGDFPQVGWCDTPGYAEAITILDDESIAFMACGTAGLVVVDYSDTTNIHVVGNYDGGGYAKELIYKDNLIYMTVELAGVQVINVDAFYAPYIVGSVDTEFALGIDVDEKYIYVADEDEGLIVIAKPN